VLIVRLSDTEDAGHDKTYSYLFIEKYHDTARCPSSDTEAVFFMDHENLVTGFGFLHDPYCNWQTK
jgi:hypothetical protein